MRLVSLHTGKQKQIHKHRKKGRMEDKIWFGIFVQYLRYVVALRLRSLRGLGLAGVLRILQVKSYKSSCAMLPGPYGRCSSLAARGGADGPAVLVGVEGVLMETESGFVRTLACVGDDDDTGVS